MGISNQHNLARPRTGPALAFGLRVSLKGGDPFAKLLGADWQRTHWYASAAERDAALAEMSRRHEYSRPADSPSHIYTKVENLAASRSL
jgi:hypothetical protein